MRRASSVPLLRAWLQNAEFDGNTVGGYEFLSINYGDGSSEDTRPVRSIDIFGSQQYEPGATGCNGAICLDRRRIVNLFWDINRKVLAEGDKP